MEIIARLANLPGALPGACAQGLIWGIMAIGVYLTYRILDVADLTVDGSFGTGGAVCVMCLLSGQNVWVSLLMALLAGLLSGLVTGVLHTFMGIPAILAGILTQLSLYSINLKIMGKANQAINVDKYNLLISLRWVKEFALHNPIVMIIIVTAVLIGILYWLFGTELGCDIRATGSNPAMSRAQGINTNFNIVLGLAVSNGLVALSGALLSQYQGFADVGMGRGAIVIGLAAVIIGEALFSRIFHNFALKMVSVSLGAIIYYIVIQLVLTLGFDANLLKLLSGHNVWFALFMALVAGLLTGLVTGLFHTFMGIPAILAGILTQLSLYSINLKIMGKANQSINVDKNGVLISLRWVKEFALRNPLVMVGIITVVLIAIMYWFFGTELGCGIRATGANPNMSRAQGINTGFNTVLGLMISNGLVALAGALLAQYQGFADVSMGRGAIVIGLAAIIIGEALFGKIFHNFGLRLLGVSLGAVVYYIVIQVVILLGLDANLLKLLSASVVAVFLAVPYWKSKYFAKPTAKKNQKEGAKNA